MRINVRAKKEKRKNIFRKGFTHIEFVFSAFQAWDTHPTLIVLDMYAHKIDGSETEHLLTNRYPMTDMGRIDAIAYKVYYTGTLIEEYKRSHTYAKVQKLTYTFTDIGPFLYLSYQANNHTDLQMFNRYLLKNKLTLSKNKKVHVRYGNPDYSAILERGILSEMEKSKNIVTRESLGTGLTEYLDDTIKLREKCL